MKKLTLRSGFLALVKCKKKHKRKHFVSRKRFLKDIENFDEEVRADCVRRLGERSKVTLSVAQSILGDAVSRLCRRGENAAKELKSLTPLRFKSTPGFF